MVSIYIQHTSATSLGICACPPPGYSFGFSSILCFFPTFHVVERFSCSSLDDVFHHIVCGISSQFHSRDVEVSYIDDTVLVHQSINSCIIRGGVKLSQVGGISHLQLLVDFPKQIIPQLSWRFQTVQTFSIGFDTTNDIIQLKLLLCLVKPRFEFSSKMNKVSIGCIVNFRLWDGCGLGIPSRTWPIPAFDTGVSVKRVVQRSI
mmetsp:Transcript_11734/g.21654  ORF Transcript_11734/g.21654 Transcript_11734/m.21654 type:complete len:204 (-) Transcript_11734:348-959(-)